MRVSVLMTSKSITLPPRDVSAFLDSASPMDNVLSALMVSMPSQINVSLDVELMRYCWAPGVSVRMGMDTTPMDSVLCVQPSQVVS